MKEVQEDIKFVLLNDPRLVYVKSGGGVLTLRGLEDYPLQTKTPSIVIFDSGTNGVLHWSSHRRWMPFSVRISAVQRIFNREHKIVGSDTEKGVDEIVKDIRYVLDMNRLNGRYARMFLRDESPPTQIVDGNVHLMEKALTFEVVRLE